jgi:hypothetical protein
MPMTSWPEVSAAFDRVRPRGPVVDRVELGRVAHAALLTTIPAAAGPPLPGPVSLLTGMRVVLDDRLRPGQWCLVTAEGEVVREGEIAPPLRSACCRAPVAQYYVPDACVWPVTCTGCGRVAGTPGTEDLAAAADERTAP